MRHTKRRERWWCTETWGMHRQICLHRAWWESIARTCKDADLAQAYVNCMHSASKEMLNCFYWPKIFRDLNWYGHDQILAIKLKPLFYNKSLFGVEHNMWIKTVGKLDGWTYSGWLVWTFSLELAWREARDVCLTPIWNLTAFMWFLFPVSCPVCVPSPLALFVLSFVC